MIFGLTACTKDPESIVIPSDSSQWERKLKKHIKNLSEEDKLLLENFLRESQLNGSYLLIGDDVTIGDAIQYQKEIEEESARKSQEEEAKKSRIEKLLNEGILVEIKSKEPLYSTGLRVLPESFELKLNMTNQTGKKVTGLKGKVSFYDTFDEKITFIEIELEEDIDKDSSYGWSGVISIDDYFSEPAKDLYYTENSKIRVDFSAEIIIFDDGEVIRN